MEHYIVNGGNPLSGEVEIAGAKNAALGILAASVMTNETVTIENIPDVSDIRAILRAIQSIGAHVEKIDRHCYRINGSGINRDAIVDVDHNKLWKILKEMGIPDHLTCLLRNLYAGQEATVRNGHGTTDWFQIEKGVRQGCILSPCLYNFYAEYIIRVGRIKGAKCPFDLQFLTWDFS